MAQIPLRNRHGEIVAHTLVDDEDYARFAHLRWHRQTSKGKSYAVHSHGTRATQQSVLLHRAIIGAVPAGMVVDHANNDGLDNRRANLRLATHRQNMVNSKPRGTRPKGVAFVARGRRQFVARIRVNYRNLHLGSFFTAEEAGRAYAQAALLYNGEFARTT